MRCRHPCRAYPAPACVSAGIPGSAAFGRHPAAFTGQLETGKLSGGAGEDRDWREPNRPCRVVERHALLELRPEAAPVSEDPSRAGGRSPPPSPPASPCRNRDGDTGMAAPPGGS
ncbi:hypothetical protein GCM10028812_15770 [Ancylobacter sonchi]